MMKTKFEILKDWFFKYERRLSSLALVVGFVIDNLTLTRIDLLLDNLVLLFYLFVAGLSIVLMQFAGQGSLPHKVHPLVSHGTPITLQFAFGGLFSGFAIFYMQSASLAASWPFLLILFGLLIGNEFLRERYARLYFQTAIFYFVLFSYLIFSIPTLIGHIGPWVFVASGVVSLGLMYGFLSLLGMRVARIREYRKRLFVLSVGSVFVLMNVLYFTNIIPPIPLSLKSIEVAHLVERTTTGNYRLFQEHEPWYGFALPYETIRVAGGDRVYVFSSVFAPTDLKTTILHSWQRYEPNTGEWRTVSEIPFSIVGGRDGGYRGYTYKEAVAQGRWRVRVLTETGQVVGQVKIQIVDASNTPDLHTTLQ